ncbi:MAG: T9SS type A sorting domain-containing protein [Sediminibacterium sp.]|nr:T9SS type A sorting domain-containing protein [Sediminibacterium sp.]
MKPTQKLIAFFIVIVFLGGIAVFRATESSSALKEPQNKISKTPPRSRQITRLKLPAVVQKKATSLRQVNEKISLLVSGGTVNEQLEAERKAYEEYYANHPFVRNAVRAVGKDAGTHNKTSGPNRAWQQDYMRTMNPLLKRPTPELLPAIIRQNEAARKEAQIRSLSIPGTGTEPYKNWVERGPNNIGGRTRALVWDPNDPLKKKVWAGGVTGGLWYNDDITDSASSWKKISDVWSSLAVTCIAFDPINPKIAYVGTGEGFEVNSSVGAGIWKTINGGVTWEQLPSTVQFKYTNDLVVRNESGKSVIYAAIDASTNYDLNIGFENAGLQRSLDSGRTWKQVLPDITGTDVNYGAASLSIGKDNRLWLGTKASPYGKSETYGDFTNRGGGYVLVYNDQDSVWKVSDSANVKLGSGRVSVATAPSDANYVYSFIENERYVHSIRKTVDGGKTWDTCKLPRSAEVSTNPKNDFTNGQAEYDQVIKVDPNNPRVVIVGGVDLYMTKDAGNTWKQISRWSENPHMDWLKCSIVHADQHAIVYKSGSSDTVIFGTDGGVFYSANILKADSNAVIDARNKNYNVTQFYTVAIHPEAGKDYYLAGSQDNGTQRFTLPRFDKTTDIYGGDGGYTFINQKNPRYQIVSYIQNVYGIHTTETGGYEQAQKLLADDTSGSFINIACYDDSLNMLYTYKYADAKKIQVSLYRIKIVERSDTPGKFNPVIDSIIVKGTSFNITAMRLSPYSKGSSTVFAGTSSGMLYKIKNADKQTYSVELMPGNLPIGSISCIEVGASEDELLVTYFNYGVEKIWYTKNGGLTWENKKGNIPDIPVRWSLFNPNNRLNEVILATELGIYGTTNFSAVNPIWALSNNGFANVRTDMLQIRNSDQQVVAATFGRGLYTSYGFAVCSTKIPVVKDISYCKNVTTQPLTASIPLTGNSLKWYTQQLGGTGSLTPPVPSSDSVKMMSYYVSEVNANGCESERARLTVTIHDNPLKPVISKNGIALNTPAVENYQWLLNNSPIAGATTSTHYPLLPGNYNVVAVNQYGCSDTSLVHRVSDFNFSIFPNPAHSEVWIDLEYMPRNEVYIRIIGSNGAEYRRIKTQQQRTKMVVAGLPSGIYYVEVNYGKWVQTLQLVVQ